jgi:hypothetical protein
VDKNLCSLIFRNLYNFLKQSQKTCSLKLSSIYSTVYCIDIRVLNFGDISDYEKSCFMLLSTDSRDINKVLQKQEVPLKNTVLPIWRSEWSESHVMTDATAVSSCRDRCATFANGSTNNYVTRRIEGG